MERLTLELPSMYGDHHVLEVRRVLLQLPGIREVFASSCFHSVEIGYDPTRIAPAAISARLAEAGYGEDLAIPAESGIAAYGQDGLVHVLRHSAAYEQVGSVISFAQSTSQSERPLWPCPGMGVLKQMDE